MTISSLPRTSSTTTPTWRLSGVGDNHAEVAVDRLKRRQAEIGVQTNDFGDDVAHLGEKFSADVFDFVGAEAADFFDDRERQGEMVRAAAHEERGRDDQRQRNFQRELGAVCRHCFAFRFRR